MLKAETRCTHQHPVLDRGGSRGRGGTVTFVVPSIRLRLELADEDRSSFGAITGSRTVGFFEGSPRLVPCITRVVAVMGEGKDRGVRCRRFTHATVALGIWAQELAEADLRVQLVLRR